ncbi:MAG: hypothetical protein L3J41_06670 [Melioribacteraceae bacterium]|nr:hypothetical protein [Melioribacteraceae bacterium]
MKYLLILIFVTTLLSAQDSKQNLESLFNSIISMQPTEAQAKEPHSITANTQPTKCGFGIVASANFYFDEFSFEQQNIIRNILGRPDRATSIVSPSGIFRIHYDTTGIHAPDYFNGSKNTIQLSVDSLAIAFDSSYNFEINILGYDVPPSDGIDGGDDLYDVYISMLGGGLYGYTEWESIGEGKSKSYIIIDNKMNVPTPGILGAKVTAAHEFHHAIQIGNYRDNIGCDTYYYELSATAMEEFVYDSINDYYFYLPPFFKKPDRRFTYMSSCSSAEGYERVLWNIFLKEHFEQKEGNANKGFDLIKRSWELMRDPSRTAIEAINLAIVENGMSMKTMFSEFGKWLYFTGYRTKENKYFSEAINYPLVKPLASYNYNSPKKTYMMTAEALANNYVVFDLSSSGVNDTLISIITNYDIANAAKSPFDVIEYEYSLMTTGEDGSTEIIGGYYSKVESENNEYLFESNIFNNEVVNGTTITRNEIDFAYPQPFNYSKNSFVFFPTRLSQYGIAKLTIYSTSMNLIFSDNLQIYNSEKIVVRWDGKDNNGNNVPSGIYIYITESDGELVKGKLAIINN